MRNHKIITLLVGILLSVIYGPLFWTSLKALDDELIQRTFIGGTFLHPFLRSLILAFSSALVALILSLMLVVKLHSSRWDFLQEKIFWLALSLPEIILSLSLLSLFVLVDWPLGFFSTLCAHICLALPFAFIILKRQHQILDISMIEAARDLGADEKKVFWFVILPNLKPALIASFWICVLLSLDDFLLTFFVSGSGYETLPLKIYSLMKVGLSPELNVLSLVILLISFGILTMVYTQFRKGIFHAE